MTALKAKEQRNEGVKRDFLACSKRNTVFVRECVKGRGLQFTRQAESWNFLLARVCVVLLARPHGRIIDEREYSSDDVCRGNAEGRCSKKFYERPEAEGIRQPVKIALLHLNARPR